MERLGGRARSSPGDNPPSSISRASGNQSQCERANFAHRLYTSEGYQVVERGPNSDTMVKEFPPNA